MNNDNVRDNSSKQILLSVLGVAILVVAVVGVSFAAFTFTGTGTKENRITTGTISMTYSEADSDVRLYLEKKTGSSHTSVMEPKAYTPLEYDSELGTPTGAMVLYSGTHSSTTVDNFRLRMWLSDTAVVDENDIKVYTVKVNVYGKAA